jgi:hypothetical protein
VRFSVANWGQQSNRNRMQPSNILKIESLNDNWHDKDSVMLHACFQLLKDCVEKEKLLSGHIDWDADDRHRVAKIEIEELYRWWLSYVVETDFSDDEVNYEIENGYLVRLIKIRWALWT